ncbi:myotrophin [Arctopsyche grandis]|uniref:myotrophin n=1 Tax=Arctopsyche grandis TaxID=121162 RepID=UPI00406D710A
MSQLVWGIKNGDIDEVRSIVDVQKINVNEAIDGRVPLHYAADYGQKDVLTYLLDKGANPNVVDKHGISVLLAAIWEGHTDCVQILLKNGASKTGVTPDGMSYMDAAEKQEIKQLLT